MKYLLTTLIAFMFVFTGCEKKTTDSDNNNEVQSYSSINNQQNSDYFDFTTNSGSLNENSQYDIRFYVVMWQPVPAAPIIPDPRFVVKDGLSVAVLEDSNLDDITEVPSSTNFINNFVSEKGESYEMSDTHTALPAGKVYIVNTSDGRFPAFQITSFYGGTGDIGTFNFDWKYLSE